jgi:uncharacterized membrane protein
MRVIVDTEIDAPRQVVWRYIADPDRCREFMDGITQWESEGKRRTGLGARLLIRMRVGSADLGGRIEIVEFDPPCDLAWAGVTGVDHRGRWRLRPSDGSRKTRVELRMTYHAAGGVMALLADMLAYPVVRGHLQRSLAALKQHVEGRRRKQGSHKRRIMRIANAR